MTDQNKIDSFLEKKDVIADARKLKLQNRKTSSGDDLAEKYFESRNQCRNPNKHQKRNWSSEFRKADSSHDFSSNILPRGSATRLKPNPYVSYALPAAIAGYIVMGGRGR